MTKLSPGWAAKHAFEQAKRGDPGPLIARLMLALQGRGCLRDGEYWFIIETLEATASKRTNARMRDLERWLIAEQFDGLVDEEGMTPKQAMDVVKKDRNCSTGKIRGALRAHGKSRRFR